MMFAHPKMMEELPVNEPSYCIPRGLYLTALIQRHVPRLKQDALNPASSLSTRWTIG